MINNEKLIVFPVPNWNRIISSELDSMAYCICYQYGIDSNGFGPYGFNTEKAEKIISTTFPNLMFLEKDNEGFISLKDTKIVQQFGIYLYGNSVKLESLKIELKNYYIEKKKNEIKFKKSMVPISLPTEPLIMSLLNKHQTQNDTIKKLVNSNIGLIFCHHYMPEAGLTLIMFERKILLELKKNATYYKVNFVELSSIDEIKAW
ncbi:hypothetical protein [Gilliamella apicola]|uniref:Uncharacterized protein n=1 Tax=Gilliamella apicola TaxID=1196095 RepID=A0A242NE31_9GAMM|nr:hypothetical protein [Gilliamella apicola]OTP82482.1 hypothetical protein B5S40_06865 [Gilliamella apicola]OTP84856.1 hypothetical protein B5S44_08275 [Gilliamella apicola]OTP87060.1 hypothetical protein B5S42_11520 [Gilliamella apicola]OTP98014.1 hypothetical protein B6D08_12545 [Gilliamella apicola]OTQ08135.1 hypothetical protein B6C87_11910 [Gilliamella apicola]